MMLKYDSQVSTFMYVNEMMFTASYMSASSHGFKLL